MNENANNSPGSHVHKSERSKLVGRLLSQLSDLDSEDEGPHTLHASQTNTTPWRAGFIKYLNMTFELGAMTIVKCWGVRVLFILELDSAHLITQFHSYTPPNTQCGRR